MSKTLNKCKKKLLAFGIAIPSIIIPVCIGLTSCSNDSKPTDNPLKPTIPNKKKLTKEIVNQNFAENGIWFNKKIITTEDWSDFSLIEYNAFDDITFQIDELNIPQNIMLSNPENGIIWKNVSKIKWLEKETGHNVTFTRNNIIYILGNNADYIALTIADRTLNMDELILAQKADLKLNYMISSNFYHESVFKNINHIKFPQDTPLYSLAKGAFNNCQKLDSILNLSIDLKINGSHVKSKFIISENTFNNSNITELSINAKNTDLGTINLSQFGNLELFKKLSINNISELYMQQSYKEENKITDLVISNSNKVVMDEFLFKNSYSLNNLQVQANEWIYCKKDLFFIKPLSLNIKLISKNIVLHDSFQNTKFDSFNLTLDTLNNLKNPIYLTNNSFVNIDCPIDNFSISYPSGIEFNAEQINFQNSGLTDQQLEKLLPLN